MPRFVKRLPEYLYRLFRSRQGYGPYRFIIRDWKEISDIDLAIGVLDSQFFDTDLIPQPLPVDDLRSILVLAPHQDDETIGAGGTLLLAKKAGVELHVLFVTDGRSKGAVSYAATPEEVVQVRNREAAEVCSLLGAQIHHLGINNANPVPSVGDLDRLCREIERLIGTALCRTARYGAIRFTIACSPTGMLTLQMSRRKKESSLSATFHRTTM
jgi:hypothetical protein